MVILLSGLICMVGATSVWAEEVKEWKVWNLKDYEKETGKRIEKFNEAPMFKKLVATGELPSLEKRLPEEPLVVEPVEGIGKYGGSLNLLGIRLLEGGEFYHVTGALAFVRPLMGGPAVVPCALKGFDLSEDGKTYTLYLRKGLKWSDGAPVTAEDILFWWEDLTLNEELTPTKPKSWMAADELPTVEKVNDYEVRFHWVAPKWNAHFLYSSGMVHHPILPKHVLMKYHIKYNKDADKLAKEKGYDHWYELFKLMIMLPYRAPEELNLAVPTLAPWILKKQLPDAMIFERNPYYFQVDTEGNQLPYIDEVKVISVADTEVYKMKALAGEIDFVNWGLALTSYPLFAKEAQEGKYRLQISRGVWSANAAYWFNLHYEEDPVLGEILADKRFRQALSLAIDRNDINETLYFGKAVPAQLTVIPALPYYKEEWARSYAEYDPQKANQLLDEMGLKWDKDHIYRLRSDGNTLTVEVVTMTNHLPDYIPILEIVKGYWEKVGVLVHVKPVLKFYQYQYCDENKFHIRSRVAAYLTESESIALYQSWLRGQAGDISPDKFAPNWAKWGRTDGEEGTEPPGQWKDYTLKCKSLADLPPEERDKVIVELLEIQAEELMGIGTVGMVGTPAVIANDLGNVPEDFYGTGTFLYFHPLRPQDWYWKK